MKSCPAKPCKMITMLMRSPERKGKSKVIKIRSSIKSMMLVIPHKLKMNLSAVCFLKICRKSGENIKQRINSINKTYATEMITLKCPKKTGCSMRRKSKNHKCTSWRSNMGKKTFSNKL